MLDVSFWENRYEMENTPWDLAGPSPHFAALLGRNPDFLKQGSMAVLGSGRGHDAALFGKAGFKVTGFDYALGAIQSASSLYGQWVQFRKADIFTLADPALPDASQFDYVLEHTCFCAILPERRIDYARTASNLLKPGGYLIGVFWEHGDKDGPPFSATPDELQQVFGENFEFISMEDRPPAPGRSGVERLVVLRRKTEV